MLENYLKEHFNIDKSETLSLPITNKKILLANLLENIKSLGAEERVLGFIAKFQLTDKKLVLSALTGFAERIELDKIS